MVPFTPLHQPLHSVSARMDEFGIIKSCFAPLASEFSGGLNLEDDAAVFTPPSGHELVITNDAICEGIHFFGNESARLIALKAMSVNISDLAAKGAAPLCYFIAIMLPKTTGVEWIRNFASGLQEAQDKFSIKLAGGDSTSTTGKLAISITAIGIAPIGSTIKRSGAKINDDIYVSGTLGDSALGLNLLQSLISSGNAAYIDNDWLSSLSAPDSYDNRFLIERYLLPTPRLSIGQELRGIATSCMDISDGLLQDMGHICTASHVGAQIYAEKIPLSQAARNMHAAFEAALSGGDDYELLFTAPPEKSHLIPKTCHRIGRIVAGNSAILLDENGKDITTIKKGFSHFNML